jgi:hypothetical protein
MTSLRSKAPRIWCSAGVGLLGLVTASVIGCARSPSSEGSAPPAPGAIQDMPDINAAIKSASAPVPGANQHTVTVIGKHTVTVATDVAAGTSGNDDQMTVTFGSHKIVFDFAKQRILLDNDEPRNMPADAKQVNLQYVGGKLKVTIDGQPASLPESPQ